MSAFDRAFNKLIGFEGGYVFDSNDPGGETKFGISKRSFPGVDIPHLNLERAKDIYWVHFWVALRLGNMPETVASEVFEVAVNSGPRMAVMLLQRALNFLGAGVSEDGRIGPQTASAVSELTKKNLPALLVAQNGEQYAYYKRVIQGRIRRGEPEPWRFAAGWLRRVEL